MARNVVREGVNTSNLGYKPPLCWSCRERNPVMLRDAAGHPICPKCAGADGEDAIVQLAD